MIDAMAVAKQIQTLLHERRGLRVSCVDCSKMSCDSMFANLAGTLGSEFDLVVFVQGPRGVFSELRDEVLGKKPVGKDKDPPYMIVVASDHFFTFSREDPNSIPAYLLRWHEKKTDPDGWACVVCMNKNSDCDERHFFATCPRCACKMCSACFPSLIFHESEACQRNLLRCPQCRHIALACDVLHLDTIGLRLQQSEARSLWAVFRAALTARPDRRTGLVVVRPGGDATIIADVSMAGRDRRVRVESPHWRLAIEWMKVEGTLIGVGSLPERGRSVGAPALERFDVDPAGRAYMSLGGGRVLEINRGVGWPYVCGVYL